ncbi:MAG: hypothetical protein IJ335_10645 [Lachnospiraceae bacterium]|nr:hypothetical protein [Lachnospiraceae bacterium]
MRVFFSRENLSAGELEKLHEEAEKVLKSNLDISKDQDYLVEMKPVKLFLTTDGKRTNRLYDVYEVRYNTGNGEAVYYVWASFKGVIVKKDGQLSLKDTVSGCAGYPIVIQDSVSIYGYDSMETVEVEIDVTVRGEMELKVLDLQ